MLLIKLSLKVPQSEDVILSKFTQILASLTITDWWDGTAILQYLQKILRVLAHRRRRDDTANVMILRF